MKKEDKNQLIDSLAKKLVENPTFYLTDISDLTVEDTNKLRRLCFNKKVSLQVVKNSLLKKAMERTENNYDQSLFGALKGSTSIMFCETGNTPAKLINEFRKKNKKPILKAAYVESSVYIGDNQLDALANLKSKNELIGEIIGLLQSPAKNVISALQSGKTTLAGIVKTLSDKKE